MLELITIGVAIAGILVGIWFLVELGRLAHRKTAGALVHILVELNHLDRREETMPGKRPRVRIRPGDQLARDGWVWTVAGCGVDGVYGIRSGVRRGIRRHNVFVVDPDTWLGWVAESRSPQPKRDTPDPPPARELGGEG
jgi:hypothetical protein